MIKVGIIQAGYANYHSIVNAIEHCGYEAKLIDKVKKNFDFTHLILPGVGQFGTVANNLRNKGLDDYIFDHVKKGNLFLGICVGFQLLFSASEESSETKGLSFFKEKIENLSNHINTVPNIGWKKVDYKECKLFNKMNKKLTNNFYFAHSYFLANNARKEFISSIKIENKKIIVAVEKDNIMGVQFHPEKSSDNGMQIIKNFCNL